jgi:hypothetical protein
VGRGEQAKFIIPNVGALKHEFVLGNTAENLKHAALMQKYPDRSTTTRTERRSTKRGFRNPLALHQAREVGIRMPDPRSPGSRHDRQDRCEVNPKGA